MKNVYKKILLKKYNELDLELNSTRKKRLLREIDDLLSNEKTLDSDDYHLWGLSYYETETDINYHTSVALDKFLEAIKLNPAHFLARLYTAHCFHDKNNLEKALEHYLQVDKEELRKFQVWRYVKLLEQIGYCYYKLDKKSTGEQFFKQLLDWYKILPEQDRPVPIEMINCLPENHPYIIEMKKIEDYL